MGQKDQLVALALLHADAAKPVLTTPSFRGFAPALAVGIEIFNKNVLTKLDAFIANMHGGAGNELAHFALALAAKRTRRMYRIVVELWDMRVPIVADGSLESFFERRSDLEQLSGNFPAFRRTPRFEKFADRLLKQSQRSAVLLIID
jgi:hypothetical protein